MPIFNPPDPTARELVPFRLLRTPPAKPIRGIITSPSLVTARTHYANNRTVPCGLQTPCPLCEEGFAWRHHTYVSLVLSDTYEHVILELTFNAAETLRNLQRVSENLRGTQITTSRPSGRPNGRIVVALRPGDPVRTSIPDPPNIERILCHIWGIKYDAPKNSMRDQLRKALAETADHLKPPA